MALFLHSQFESRSIHMLFSFIIFLAMAGFGFGFDDDDFSLSGLTQESRNNVTVISSSDDENYDGLMACACKLAGKTSDKSSMEGTYRQVLSHVSSHVSSQLCQISRFQKQLILD